MVLWLVGSASAQATFSSDPGDLVFSDTLDLFTFVSVDTGYQPSASSPLAVRFHVTPSGGIVTEMEAVSALEWPTAFKHSLEAVPGEGWFGIDTHVDIDFEVKIDVSVYSNTLSLWSQDFDITEIVPLDTLVLPGSPEYPTEVAFDQTGLIDPFEVGYDVIPGVGLNLAVEIFPQLAASFAGNRIESTLGSSVGAQDGEGGFVQLDPPAGNPGEVFVSSTYFADLGTVFALVIRPSAELDTVVGDYTLAQFDIPIDLLDSAETRAFPPSVTLHPLPAIDDVDVVGDLGTIDVGDLANLEVPLSNLGALGLEGTAHIEGGDAFSVYPTYFYASEDRTDGVVVTFAPLEDGEQLATLVLNTNDPVTPVLRIPLVGTGRALTSVDGPPGDNGNVSRDDIKTCGCAASGGGASGVWLLLGALVLGRRRA